MKFIISRQELAELVTRVQNIVAPKTPIPILSNLLLEAKEDQIVLTATDLTVAVRCCGAAKVIEEGATTLPARRLAQLVRELTAHSIEITTNEKEVTQIIADSSNFKIVGMSKNEFPALPELAGSVQLKVLQKDLKDALYRTSFAVSKEDSRYILTGVYMEVSGNIATFVGTDGKRLAKARLELQDAVDTPTDCIIPIKAVDEIMKSLDQDEEYAVMYLFRDKIAVEAGDILIMTKLLFGEYPDVEKVIPKQVGQCVDLHRDELLQLLRQIALFTNDQSHSVRFKFIPGELQLTATSMDVGEGRVSMPVNYQGMPFEIAFNPHFFIDLLRHSKNESVSMGFSDAYNPGIFADATISSFENMNRLSPLFVLMPMRIGDE